jgi:hypothetical protein
MKAGPYSSAAAHCKPCNSASLKTQLQPRNFCGQIRQVWLRAVPREIFLQLLLANFASQVPQVPKKKTVSAIARTVSNGGNHADTF